MQNKLLLFLLLWILSQLLVWRFIM